MASSVEPIKSTKSLKFPKLSLVWKICCLQQDFLWGGVSFLAEFIGKCKSWKRLNQLRSHMALPVLRLRTGSSGCKLLSASGMPTDQARAEGWKTLCHGGTILDPCNVFSQQIMSSGALKLQPKNRQNSNNSNSNSNSNNNNNNNNNHSLEEYLQYEMMVTRYKWVQLPGCAWGAQPRAIILPPEVKLHCGRCW